MIWGFSWFEFDCSASVRGFCLALRFWFFSGFVWRVGSSFGFFRWTGCYARWGLGRCFGITALDWRIVGSSSRVAYVLCF